MRQVTLVALYGEKTGELATQITECQRLVTQAFGGGFEAYDIQQVHATIIGLERRAGSPNWNANFAAHRGREVAMDFEGFLCYLRECGHFPCEVQIGGFASRSYPFTSGLSPRKRKRS